MASACRCCQARPAVVELEIERAQRLAVAVVDRPAASAPAGDGRTGHARSRAWPRASPSPSRSAARRCSSGMEEEAVVLLAQQRLVEQRAEHRQRRRDRPRRLGGEAAAEDREPRRAPRARPGRAASRHGRRPSRCSPAAPAARIDGAQQLAALAQLGGDLGAGQHPRPRGRQLERQRQAADLAADVDQRLRLGVGEEASARPAARRARTAAPRRRPRGGRRRRPRAGAGLRAGRSIPRRCRGGPGWSRAGAGAGSARSASRSAAPPRPAARSCRARAAAAGRAATRSPARTDRSGRPARRRPRAPAGCRARPPSSRPRGRRRRRRRRSRGASSAIRRRARRVLPTPPGPTRLIRRQSSCASSSAMRRRSSERPTKPSSPASAVGRGGHAARCGGAPTRLSCSACSSAPGARPRSSRRRPTNVAVDLAAATGLAARAPARCRCWRSAASSSGSASSSRPVSSTARVGVDRRRRPAAGRARAPGGAQPVALEAEPAGPGFACRRRRSRRAGRRRRAAGRRRCGRSRSAASNSATSVGISSRARLSLELDRPAPGDAVQAEQRLAQVGEGELLALLGPEDRRQLGPADPGALQREVDQELAAALEGQRDRPAAEIDRRRAEEVQAGGHRGRQGSGDFPVRRVRRKPHGRCMRAGRRRRASTAGPTA